MKLPLAQSGFSRFLVLCLLCLVVGGLLAGLGYLSAISSPSESMSSTPPAQSEQGQHLLSTNNQHQVNTAEGFSFPLWLAALTGAVVLLQASSLVLALFAGGPHQPGTVQHERTAFLCEVPMYLGLLGSLVGVCVTQFLTGSLAAPLAYLTTISGIVLYIFGKFSILLRTPQTTKSNGNDTAPRAGTFVLGDGE